MAGEDEGTTNEEINRETGGGIGKWEKVVKFDKIPPK